MRPFKRSGLEPGVTTLMLRRLPEDWGALSVLHWLQQNKIKLRQIDFLYVPFDKHTNTNIELAFINFVDSATAKQVYKLVVKHNKELIWDVVVSAGNVQGFEWNLAYFLIRFGPRATWGEDAPLIFRNGAQLRDREEIAQAYADIPSHVLDEAARFVRAETAGSPPRGTRRRAQRPTWRLSAETMSIEQFQVDGSEEELLSIIRSVDNGAWVFSL